MNGDDMKLMPEKMMKKRLYLALQYPTASQEEMLDHIPEHLEYMAEREDRIFLSGPLVQEGVTVGEGLTVLKTDDEAEARDGEPLVKRGLRRYELKLWRIQEGSMTVRISGVNSTANLD